MVFNFSLFFDMQINNLKHEKKTLIFYFVDGFTQNIHSPSVTIAQRNTTVNELVNQVVVVALCSREQMLFQNRDSFWIFKSR
jgi:hypothetical protein